MTVPADGIPLKLIVINHRGGRLELVADVKAFSNVMGKFTR